MSFWPTRPQQPQPSDQPKYFLSQELGHRLNMGEVEIAKQLVEENRRHGVSMTLAVSSRDTAQRPLTWVIELSVKTESGLAYLGYINYEFRKKVKALESQKQSVMEHVLNTSAEHPSESKPDYEDPLLNWHPIAEACTFEGTAMPEVKLALPSADAKLRSPYYGMPWTMQARTFHGWKDGLF